MILIVDDNPDLAETCAMLLSAYGYTVDVAADGIAALESVSRRMPDLILSDCQMPRLSGIELCARVRTLTRGVLVPIILMSGTNEYRHLTSANYDAFLQKPFRAQELLSAVQGLLDPVPALAG